jgi:predicted NBD/HSP70 family sugar kinase
VTAARPSLDLLRSLTDEHVLRALMRHPRLTRAELAAETGISKPSVGESVLRLAGAGLVADTGERTAGGRGRGRVGTYYALAPGAGRALAVSVAPDGIVAECLDAHGDVRSRAETETGRPARPQPVAAALRAVTARALGGAADHAPGAVRAVTVSVAGPVDRATGRLARLPDEPFRLGELDAAAVLGAVAGGPATVDNDVNWAARAERDSADSPPGGDFAYLFLGEGLGVAVVSDGKVIRGQHGLAGEVAHLIVPGPGGQAARFIDVFGVLGLRQPGTTAIDTGRVLAVAGAGGREAAAVRDALGQAAGGVLAALVALADPQEVVVGGPWGQHPAILASVTAAAARLPRQVAVRAARVTSEPSLAGARAAALRLLRSAVVTAARSQPGRRA